MKNYPVGVFHQVRENITNRIDCTVAQTAVIFEAMEHAKEWAGQEQKRAEVAEARVRELEAALTGICEEFEATIREAENKGGGGMRVPFHGDFAAAVQLPSVVSRFAWWVRLFRKALEGGT